MCDGRQFVYNVANKRLYEINILKPREQKMTTPQHLQGKGLGSLSKYCTMYDQTQLQERVLEETRIQRTKIRPSFTQQGINGDAMNFILNQCFLKSNPTIDYYAVFFNQLVGLHQDTFNKK